MDPAAQEANLNTTYRKRTYQQDIQADQKDQAAQVDPEDREDQADPVDQVSQIRVHQSKQRSKSNNNSVITIVFAELPGMHDVPTSQIPSGQPGGHGGPGGPSGPGAFIYNIV